MYLPTSNQNSHQRKRKWSVSPLEVGGQVTRFPGCIVRCRCIALTLSCTNTKLSLAHTNLVRCKCIEHFFLHQYALILHRLLHTPTSLALLSSCLGNARPLSLLSVEKTYCRHTLGHDQTIKHNIS